MLNTLTKSFKNLGSKILIIVIALSFAVWGIGDIFTTNTSNLTIAKVGNTKIKLNEFQLDYQLLVDRLRQANNQPITEDFLKTIGMHNNVLDNIITKKYINILANNLDITIADKYIKKSIISNPIFFDQLGVFNKDYFNYYLSRNNLKEKDLYNITKNAISNDLLLQSIAYSQFVPKTITNNIIKKRDLVRKAKVFTFDASSIIITDKTFSDEQIQKKYQATKNNFMIPETRNIKVIKFPYKKIKDQITVSSDELKSFYDLNSELYVEEETRDIYMVQFKTEEMIKQFVNENKKSPSFYKTLEKFKIVKEDIYLGRVKYDDLDADTSNIVFKLTQGQTSQILKTSFGYKVFYLDKVYKEKVTSFESEKEKIKLDIIKEKTNETIYSIANIFYEKFLQTRNLTQALENIDVELDDLKDLGLNNIKNTNLVKSMVIDENELAKISFNLKLNDISEIIEDTENNLYYIYLEKVNKSEVKSLETVKDDIVNLLYDDERKRVAKNAAESFKKNYLNNKILEKNSKKFFYSELTDWITLDNRLGKKIDYNLKKLIFSTKINSLSKIISTKDKKFVIALPIEQSDRILSEDQKSDFNDTMTEINNSLEGDLSNAILNDLNKLYTSNINQKFLESF